MASGMDNKLLKSNAINIFLALGLSASLILSLLLSVSCSKTNSANEKISSQLLAQVDLREEQLADPTSERLEKMKSMGMRLDNLEIHRTFIHLNQELITSQIDELEAMGITLYLDSWIPPVGKHPTGYMLADVPIDKLEALAEKSYIVRLETAEKQLEPLDSIQPQSD